MVLNTSVSDPLRQYLDIMLFYLYFCHLLEFNSHLTGDPRSTKIADDNSPNNHVNKPQKNVAYLSRKP